MKTSQISLFFISIILLFAACQDKPEVYNVQGTAEKGPFKQGANVTLSELDKDLIQTGKMYTTNTLDEKGTFDLDNIKLSSDYVLVKVVGEPYSETVGSWYAMTNTTLYGLAKITHSTTIHVNILTHLAKERIEYLVSEGNTFDQANTQAISEIKAIFGFDTKNITALSDLTLAENSDNGALLLAVSAIFDNTEAMQYANDFAQDIKKDGTLDNVALQTSLVTSARCVPLQDVRTNMVALYTTVPDFESYITQFIEKNTFGIPPACEFKENNLGINILTLPDTTTLTLGQNYSIGLQANQPMFVLLFTDPGDVLQENSAQGWEYQSAFGQNIFETGKSAVSQITPQQKGTFVLSILVRSYNFKTGLYMRKKVFTVQ